MSADTDLTNMFTFCLLAWLGSKKSLLITDFVVAPKELFLIAVLLHWTLFGNVFKQLSSKVPEPGELI